MSHVVFVCSVLAVLAVLAVVAVVGLGGEVGAVLCMLGRASLRRMLPHAAGFAAWHRYSGATFVGLFGGGVSVGRRGLADGGFVAGGIDGVHDLLIRH
ncbi:hypothetical protein D3C73_1129610 [compost metagenome]